MASTIRVELTLEEAAQLFIDLRPPAKDCDGEGPTNGCSCSFCTRLDGIRAKLRDAFNTPSQDREGER